MALLVRVLELIVLRFPGKMSETCQASSAKVYLAAVHSLHISQGYPFLNLLRIPLVVRGLRRAKRVELNAPKLHHRGLGVAYC